MKLLLAILLATIVAVVFVLPQVDLDPTIVKISQLLGAVWIVVLLLLQRRTDLLKMYRVQAAFLPSSPISSAKATTKSPTLLC